MKLTVLLSAAAWAVCAFGTPINKADRDISATEDVNFFNDVHMTPNGANASIEYRQDEAFYKNFFTQRRLDLEAFNLGDDVVAALNAVDSFNSTNPSVGLTQGSLGPLSIHMGNRQQNMGDMTAFQIRYYTYGALQIQCPAGVFGKDTCKRTQWHIWGIPYMDYFKGRRWSDVDITVLGNNFPPQYKGLREALSYIIAYTFGQQSELNQYWVETAGDYAGGEGRWKGWWRNTGGSIRMFAKDREMAGLGVDLTFHQYNLYGKFDCGSTISRVKEIKDLYDPELSSAFNVPLGSIGEADIFCDKPGESQTYPYPAFTIKPHHP